MSFGDGMVSVGVDIDIKEIDTIINSQFMSEIEDGVVLKSGFKVLWLCNVVGNYKYVIYIAAINRGFKLRVLVKYFVF